MDFSKVFYLNSGKNTQLARVQPRANFRFQKQTRGYLFDLSHPTRVHGPHYTWPRALVRRIPYRGRRQERPTIAARPSS